MTIDNIREFIELANIGNYEEAAFHLFITQSTLSKHIQNLELELGGPLFNRGRGKVELTDFGKKYLPCAKQIVQMHTDFVTESTIRRNSENCLRIGYPPQMDAYGFFDSIKAFCDMYPDITLFLEDEQVSEKLRSGEIDFAILFEDPEQDNKNTIVLRQDRLVPVVSVKHPLAKQPCIPISALRAEPFISFPPGILLEKYCTQLCRNAGFEPNTVFRVSAPDGRHLINLVCQNFGVALIPEQEALYWATPEIVVGEPDMTLNLNICVQFESDHDLSREEKDFVTFLKSREVC